MNMKKLSILLAVAIGGLLSVNAQTNNVIWLNGSAVVGQSIHQVDSLNKATVEGADTLCLLLPRMAVERETVTINKVIHETVFIRDTVKADTPDIPEGALRGAFSVSADKQVHFAKGNLQYTQSAKTWAFAEHQYDIIGTDNVTGGEVTFDAKKGYETDGATALADKIDLFGWSGSIGSAKWGVSTSSDDTDYSGDFADWGANIGDGKTWYTLSKDEWEYVLKGRTNATSLKGAARINLNDDGSEYINGVVLLPDDWTCPAGVAFKSGFSNGLSGVQVFADYQQISLSDWQQLEDAGAVFFPATGYRHACNDVMQVQYEGYYWSATSAEIYDPFGPEGGYTSIQYYYANFCSTNARVSDHWAYTGMSVRLVQDVK